MHGRGLAWVTGTAALLALGAPAPAQQAPAPADLVLRGGRIWTGDPERPEATALAARGSQLVAVGSEADVAPLVGPATRVVDLRGAFACPGLSDAHAHAISGGRTLLSLDLMGAATLDAALEKVRAAAASRPKGSAIRGRGWDHTLWGERWPTAADLDRVAPDHPVALARVDGHVVWANSLALRLSGITTETRDPAGGALLRDADGRPTGILKETAAGLLKLPDAAGPTAEAAVAAALEHARRLGITSFEDGDGAPEAYATLREAGRLTARVSVWLPLEADPQKSAARRERFPPDDAWLRVATRKGFADGTMGSGTAAFFESYADTPGAAGLARYTQDRLNELVVAADRESWQVALHAIGDRAVAMALDAFEAAAAANGRRDARHRIEHVQVVRPADFPRFAALGVIASMQPCHVLTDSRWAHRRVGRARLAAGGYPWRSLLDAGATLAFGTDWPVEPLDPLANLYAAVARRRTDGEPVHGWFPAEALTAPQALRAYTAGSAFAAFAEHRRGLIRPGLWADVSVFDRDLLATPPAAWLAARCLYTVVGGKIVWDAAAEAAHAAPAPPDPLPTLEALAAIPGVTGAESAVAAAVMARLPAWARPTLDAVGTLVVEAGPPRAAGAPVPLILCHLDEIGWRVTGITDEGYLRLARPGHTAGTDVADRLLEGKLVVVQGDLGALPGAVTAQSTHLRGPRPPSFDLSRAFVEIGARSAAEAREMGAVELSPVAWRRVHGRLAGARLSGPALGDRAGAAAVLAALGRLGPAGPKTSVAIAFLAQRWYPGYARLGRGAEAVAARIRPSRVLVVSAAGEAAPGRGAVLPTAGFDEAKSALPADWTVQSGAIEDPGLRAFAAAAPRATAVGIPVRYRHSPVEIVDGADLEAAARLVARWLEAP